MDDRQKHLETILVIVLGMIVIYFFVESRYLLWGAIALGAIGVFIPFLAAKIHWAWMKLAHVLGYVMSKVMLTLVYTLVVLPMSWIARKKLHLQKRRFGERLVISFFNRLKVEMR